MTIKMFPKSTRQFVQAISVLVVVVAILRSYCLNTDDTAAHGCCSFPCQNNGVCLSGRESGQYSCDCTNLGFYGKHCEKPYLSTRIRTVFQLSPDTQHSLLISPRLAWFLRICNRVTWLQEAIMRRVYLLRGSLIDSPSVYETGHDYPTIGATTNHTVYGRTLPPVPRGCPTPMGTKGPSTLPPVDSILPLFKRGQFRPDPMGSSVLLTFFAQHFTHMFFKSDYKKGPGITWSGHGVDATSLYGKDVHTENMLRSFTDGKLKMQTLNGEEFPMYLDDAPVEMTYTTHVPKGQRFALGHPFFGLLPGLFLYQTIWMREHNRVCDVIRTDHPDWDDERLFQTGKLVIIGEIIKIVIEEYVQHLASYNFQLKFLPHVLFGEVHQYQNKIHTEFNHMYHWHPLMPDSFNISGTTYMMKDYMFHSELVVQHGTAAVTEALSRQRAGQVSHHNHGPYTLNVMRQSILEGRTLRFQSMNQYRKRFRLPVYTSFEELTGETEVAAELRKLYKDIDAVEFTTGIYAEKRRVKNLFGSTIVEMGAPYSVKGLMSNPICSPAYWKPSTFGGQAGFDIVNTATLEKLFCGNIKGKCPLVSFRVPDYQPGDVDELNNFVVNRVKEEL